MESFESLLSKIKQVKIYPNWAVVVFIVSLVMTVGAVAYLAMIYFGNRI